MTKKIGLNAKALLSMSSCLIAQSAYPVLADDFVIDAPTAITNGGNIIDGADTLTVTDTGEISGVPAAGIGVEYTGDNNAITNNGIINVSGTGVLSNMGNNSSVINNGIVAATGGGNGISITGNNAAVTNASTSLIQSNLNQGVFVEGANATIQNSGTIGANAGTIVVEGDNAQITNSGEMVSITDQGIFVDGDNGNVLNSGEIQSDLESIRVRGADAHVLNTATGNIVSNSRGIFVSGGFNAIVENRGTIASNFDGIFAFGSLAQVTNSGSITSAMADGISVDGAQTQITNSGNITATTAQGLSVDGPGAIVTNSGMISAGTIGIFANSDNAVITNTSEGEIQAQQAAADIIGDNAVFSNAGSAISSGSFGVVVSGDNTQITNSGMITSETSIGVLTSSEGVTIRNTGEVNAADNGIFSTGDRTQISNSGVVESTTGTGVNIAGNGAVVINSGGLGTAILALSGVGVEIAGENAIVVNRNAIVSDDEGVLVNGDSAQVINAGGIGSGTDSGVVVIGNDAVVTNSENALINADGEGVIISGLRGQVVNSGEVISGISDAINTTGNNGAVVNTASGVITSHAGNGVIVNGDFGVVENAGLITAAATGVLSNMGDDARIVNNGRIDADTIGIAVAGLDAFITNSGSIDGGTGGLFAGAAGATVTNTGSVTTDLANDAIAFGGGDATLNLGFGSVVQGRISLFDAGTTTLNVGLPNAALTFDGGAPATINAGANAVLVDGDEVFVVDQSGLEAVGRSAANLTRDVGNLVSARRGYIFDAPARADRGAWVGALGGSGDDSSTTGLMVGGHATLGNGSQLEFYLGQGQESLDGSTSVDTDITLVGVSWGNTTDFGFFDLSLVAGRSSHDASRRVANNLVLGGYETASASYDSTFISSSVTIGTTRSLGQNGAKITPSLSLRHTLQKIDGYTESGATTSNLTFSGRTTQTTDIRAQVAASFRPIKVGTGAWNVSVVAGLEGRNTKGDAPVATLPAGTAIPFSATDSGFEVGGFLGARTTYDLSSQSRFYASGELGAGSNGQMGVRIGVGFSAAF